MSNIFEVEAERSGDWWSIAVIEGLPDDHSAHGQSRRLNDVESTATEMIADLLELRTDDIEINVSITLPPEIRRIVDLYLDAEKLESAARTEAALARSRAAAALIEAKLTMREAGAILNVSHQRVKQLADRDSLDDWSAAVGFTLEAHSCSLDYADLWASDADEATAESAESLRVRLLALKNMFAETEAV